jgi:hypothetical protein
MAIAVIPLPSPVKPNPSVVVALTDTGTPRIPVSVRSISTRRGPIFGRFPTI